MDLYMEDQFEAYISAWASDVTNEVYTTIDYAALLGKLDDLKILYKKHNEKCKVTTLEYAVCSGNLEVTEWVYKHCPKETDTWLALAYAAGHGHLEIVKFLYSKTLTPKKMLAIKLAAFHGKLTVLEWLIQQNEFPIKYDILMKYAIGGQHPEVIKWIYEREYRDFTEVEYINCAKNGYNNIVKFFYKIFPNKNTQMSALYGAIESGNSDLSRWLNEKIEEDHQKTLLDYTQIGIKTLISNTYE